MKIEALRVEDFLPHVGRCFGLGEVGSGSTLELLGVTPAQRVAAGHRAGFSLLFRGSIQPPFGQTVVTLAHPTKGDVSMLVVPVGEDADGVHYEAIFN